MCLSFGAAGLSSTCQQGRQRALAAAPPLVHRQRARVQPLRHVVVARARKDQGPDKPRKDGPLLPEESDFDRETAQLALRMLTARAAAMVLTNISHADTHRAEWLQSFCAAHPPLEGQAFLQALMTERPVASVDPYTGATHYINPAALASAVLSTREALAKRLAKGLDAKVQDANMSLLRQHLESHTYVSGSNNGARPSYRQYRKQQGRPSAERQLN